MIIDKETIVKYYKALLERDSAFIGVFYAGVTSTSVFCISTCRARKPKKENVVFFDSFKEALNEGFRPCKICNPTANAFEAPQKVQLAIKLVKDNPKMKIKDYHLREQGIEPTSIRRWFKKHYGITFHAYQRMYRINIAYNELKSGKKATEAAFENTYESLSGFNYTFKQITGNTPKNIQQNNILVIKRFTTPLGPMFICASEEGVCLLEFVDRRMLETELKDLQTKLKAKIIFGENQHTEDGIHQIIEYFEGNRKLFTVPLDTPGTEFQKTVWNMLSEIPYGETRSYQEQAKLIHKQSAVRAVANANGHNRISIIIPCHRVIGKDGNLTGYGGGIERKKWLLEMEKRNL